MPKIKTPFAGVPDEVDDGEYAALKRQGLLGDGPADADPEPEPVEVQTRFGLAVTVSPDEAASLRRQGLAAAGRPTERTAAAQTTPPAETTPTTSKEDG